MKTYVFASGNQGKVKEVKEMIKDAKVLSLKDIGFDEEIVEDGKDFFENAMIKAKAIKNFLDKTGMKATIIADDSGLCVNSLSGEPGLNSARYGGDHDFELNRKKLLKNLEDKTDRTAFYVCTMVMLFPDGSFVSAEGKTHGEILKEKTGENGFCYDPYFLSYELKKSFGVATAEEKNSISHRKKALTLLLEKEKEHNRKSQN